MSAPILKSYVDERGNISVRVSHDVQVLTREEANRIEAEYKRMQAENSKLRELCTDVWHLFTEHGAVNPCDLPVVDAVRDRMRECGVEVDDGN